MKNRFSALVELETPLVFTRFESKADPTRPGYYPGVLVIQKGIAKGHYAVKDGNRVVNFDASNPDHEGLRKYQIVIGDDTLDDVTRCGEEAENTKCKLDHGATVRDIVGNYGAFRRDGDQVRADLTLMKSTPHREYVVELFADFSNKVGNSIDFDYKYDIQGEVAVARCVKLNSVDIVDAPAATNSLFNEPNPPTPQNNMALSKEDLDAIGKSVNDAVDAKFTKLETGLDTRLSKIETSVTKLEEGDGDKKDDKDDKKDKKDDADGGEKMSAMVNKAVLSAIQSVFPKASVANMASADLAKKDDPNTDEYADKHAALVTGGLSVPQATKFMANKHPALYNAKFGGGGDGGKKGNTKL